MGKIKTQDVLKVLVAGAIILTTPIIPPLPMIFQRVRKAPGMYSVESLYSLG